MPKYYIRLKKHIAQEMPVEQVSPPEDKAPLEQPIEKKKDDYNPQEIKMGIEIEKEHKDLYDHLTDYLKSYNLQMPMSLEEFATWITKAHLREIPNYNTLLKQMEVSAKS